MSVIKINLPVSEEDIRKLKVGDQVFLSGIMSTGRDAAHKYIMDHHPDFIRPFIKDSLLYHCGPVVAKNDDGSWRFVAAGPTTSIREEPYEAHVIEEYQLRGVIGKGGMRDKTLAALKKNGAVYFKSFWCAVRLISIDFCQLSSLNISRFSLGVKIPALLTTISIPPKLFTAILTAF